MAKPILTASRVRELLNYNPETGVLTRRVKTSNATYIGKVAGEPRGGGYLRLSVDNKRYLAHRVVWLHAHGGWPEQEVDHINGIGSDNRIENLRDVAPRVNQENTRKAYKNNAGGFLGVTFDKRKDKWQAQIKFDRRNRFLGYYKTAEDAHTAYLSAKRDHHEGCTI